MSKKQKIKELKPGTFFLYKRALYLRTNPGRDGYCPYAIRVATGSGENFYTYCSSFSDTCETEVIPVKVSLRRL